MKISKKEKLLLVMLVALLLGVVYYQFIYTKQNEKIAGLEVERSEVQTRYNEIMETIQTLDQRQEKINIYQTTIQTNSQPFYPTLVQENLILELDKFLTDNKIEGNISFTQITTAAVEPFASGEVAKPQSSLKPLMDEYNNFTGSQPNETANGEGAVAQTSSTTVEQVKVSISFNATYDNLKAFIRQLETYERQIVITNMSVTPGINDVVSGSMNLELYAFPKFETVDQDYLNWTLDNKYGKETPFSGIGASVGINTIEDLGKVQAAKNDFVVLLKSTTSELPTFMMGVGSDTTQASYINSDNEQIEEVKLELTQDGDQYFYKYNNATQSFPSSGSGLAFTPGKDINVLVTSEARVTVDDLAGIRLNVVNNTDKLVNVTITGDDTENPRITVAGEGKPVNVTKK
ncbi:MAG: GspMb/PilO family protein [Turicibacter sp.]